MKIYKTKPFDRFCWKNDIEEETLIAAVTRAEKGLVDADLGGGVIKQRIARKGEGKSGGYRVIILLKHSEKCFMVHGYPKHEKDNLTKKEEKLFKDMAKSMLNLSSQHLLKLIKMEEIVEVKSND